MQRPAVIANWHRIALARDVAALNDILDDKVTFLSPVVHTPQVGKAITLKYLTAALKVLNNDSFHYLNEWFGDTSAVLEFETVVENITINGIDIITWNDAQKIVEFKVMVRPLKAINLIHQAMGAMLQAAG